MQSTFKIIGDRSNFNKDRSDYLKLQESRGSPRSALILDEGIETQKQAKWPTPQEQSPSTHAH